MKIGPGVDLGLTTWTDARGLHAQPQPSGEVRLMATNGEPPLSTGQNLRGDATFEPSQWEQANLGSANVEVPGCALRHGDDGSVTLEFANAVCALAQEDWESLLAFVESARA